jgi:hypothetical protein
MSVNMFFFPDYSLAIFASQGWQYMIEVPLYLPLADQANFCWGIWWHNSLVTSCTN